MNFFKTNLDPTVAATTLLLKALQVKVARTTINETLQNHPEFPSLLSISDSLDRWNVENAAVTISVENINELPTPFLATLRVSEEQIWVLVKEVNETTVRYCKSVGQLEDVEQPIKAFLNESTGVALLAEANKLSGEPDFWISRKREILSGIATLTLLASFLTIGVIGFFSFTTEQTEEGYALAYLLFWSTKSIGICLSILLVWYAIDENNPALKKVCSVVKDGDCGSVLNSKYSKFLGGISWTDIGLIYFIGGLICLLTTTGLSSSIFILGWLSVLAVPYTALSIYLQWRILKKWCVLCLAVQGVLVFEAVVSIVLVIKTSVGVPDHLTVLVTLLSFIIPTLLWYFLKPVFIIYNQNTATTRNLIRLKSNRQIFDAVMEKQKKLTHSPGDLGLILGNANSENILVVVSNPVCAPCAGLHPEIEELLESNLNLKVQLLFTTGASEQSRESKLFVNYLLTAYKGGDQAVVRKILDQWYVNSAQDYNRFVKSDPARVPLDQQSSLQAMEQWCHLAEIEGTPAVFFNGKELPEIFKVADLKYILATK